MWDPEVTKKLEEAYSPGALEEIRQLLQQWCKDNPVFLDALTKNKDDWMPEDRPDKPVPLITYLRKSKTADENRNPNQTQ